MKVSRRRGMHKSHGKQVLGVRMLRGLEPIAVD